MLTINVDHARRNEGIFYGDGAANLAESIAMAASKRKSAKGRAMAAYNAICRFAAETGANPETECFMRPEHGGWRVSYESGPYSWAMPASDALAQCGILAEPYYSFDLCFYPE